MRLMPRRRKSKPCMAKSPRCVGAKHLMMSCQVGRVGSGWFRGDDFFGGRFFHQNQKPAANLVSKGNG